MPSQDEFDELDLLLAAAAEDDDVLNINNNSNITNELSIKMRQPQLTDDISFAQAFSNTSTESSNLVINLPSTSQTTTKTQSVIEKEFDSSDEEDIKNYLEQKYNEYGRDINKKLKSDNIEKKQAQIGKEVDINIMKNDPHSLFSKNKPRLGVVANNTSSISATTKSIQPKKLDPSRSFKSINKTDLSTNIFSKKNSENTVFTDPIFGLRIINPLISSSVLIERMNGRKPVNVSGLKYHIECVDLTQDWVAAGIILNKSPIKTTKTGASYSIWKMSDLKGDIKTFSLFLFKNAHKELWKTATGMCIAILNPSTFDNREGSDVACLTIDVSQKVMILGQSKDMGTCKAKKKNGENCTAFVNLGDCDYCIYHVKQEFNSMSKRSELQSSTAGRGLQELRNKILGKSEVFYAGQSYTAVPAKKSAKLIAKDQNRLQTLSEYFNSPNNGNINHTASPKLSTPKEIPYAVRSGIHSKIASNVELKTKQRFKDIERLQLLRDEAEKFQTNIKETQNNPTTSTISKGIVGNIIQNLNNPNVLPKNNLNTSLSTYNSPNITTNSKINNKTPTLSKDTFTIDLDYHTKKDALAKIKAKKLIQQKPIEKSNPNFIKYRGTTNGKKRVMEELNDYYNNDVKRRKIDEERKEYERKTRLQKIIDATSSNSHLIEIRQLDEQNKYFDKLEKKEAMEEKMLNTYHITCKAVICLICKYTAFSASDHCKTEKHKLKIIDAEKRFFKCMDCGNRTVSLQKLPKTSCKNCQSSRWQRAAMIREKKLIDPKDGLSIRGDEEKFVGTLNKSANLNLLVPDE